MVRWRFSYQADALEIEALANRRIADEYDAAQLRGEVAVQGKPSKAEGLATTADIGRTHTDIHESRQIRDAEETYPGIVKSSTDYSGFRGTLTPTDLPPLMNSTPLAARHWRRASIDHLDEQDGDADLS